MHTHEAEYAAVWCLCDSKLTANRLELVGEVGATGGRGVEAEDTTTHKS